MTHYLAVTVVPRTFTEHCNVALQPDLPLTTPIASTLPTFTHLRYGCPRCPHLRYLTLTLYDLTPRSVPLVRCYLAAGPGLPFNPDPVTHLCCRLILRLPDDYDVTLPFVTFPAPPRPRCLLPTHAFPTFPVRSPRRPPPYCLVGVYTFGDDTTGLRALLLGCPVVCC